MMNFGHQKKNTNAVKVAGNSMGILKYIYKC